MSSHSSSVKSPWVDLQVVDMEPSAFPISQAYGIWQPDGWQLCHSSGYIFTTASETMLTEPGANPAHSSSNPASQLVTYVPAPRKMRALMTSASSRSMVHSWSRDVPENARATSRSISSVPLLSTSDPPRGSHLAR